MALLVLFSCENKEESKFFKAYDESELIKNQQDHKISRMRFKLIQSKVLNMNSIFKPFNDALATNFSEEEYLKLKPLQKRRGFFMRWSEVDLPKRFKSRSCFLSE